MIIYLSILEMSSLLMKPSPGFNDQEFPSLDFWLLRNDSYSRYFTGWALATHASKSSVTHSDRWTECGICPLLAAVPLPHSLAI